MNSFPRSLIIHDRLYANRVVNLTLPPPDSLQLLFQVHGEISSALVSLEAINHTPWGRGLLYKSLVVDLPNGERLVLKGHVTDSIVEGYSTRL